MEVSSKKEADGKHRGIQSNLVYFRFVPKYIPSASLFHSPISLMHQCPSTSCRDSGSEVVQLLGPGIQSVRIHMIGEKTAVSMGRYPRAALTVPFTLLDRVWPQNYTVWCLILISRKDQSAGSVFCSCSSLKFIHGTSTRKTASSALLLLSL